MATLKKYTGSREGEAEHIKINKLRYQIAAARKQLAVKSGAADLNIVAPHRPGTLPVPTARGKYKARLIMQEQDNLDSNVAPFIKALGMNATMENISTRGFDEMSRQTIQSGEFLKGFQRVNGYADRANAIYKELGVVNPAPSHLPELKSTFPLLAQLPQGAQERLDKGILPPVIPDTGLKGKAMTPEQLQQKNKQLDEIEQRFKGIKPTPANETEEQRNRRLHPELY